MEIDMKTLNISTRVFAAVWANRKEGEEDEDAILRRILGVAERAKENEADGPSGYKDYRNGIDLPEGFEIFRVYKGTMYKANASKGKWFLNWNKKYYPTLNQLSQAIVDGNENAWNNWYYVDDQQERKLITNLRPQHA
jgi:hypothetical protein